MSSGAPSRCAYRLWGPVPNLLMRLQVLFQALEDCPYKGVGWRIFMEVPVHQKAEDSWAHGF